MILLNEFGLDRVKVEAFQRRMDNKDKCSIELCLEEGNSCRNEQMSKFKYLRQEFEYFLLEQIQYGLYEEIEKYFQDTYGISDCDTNIKRPLLKFLEKKFLDYLNDNRPIIQKEMSQIKSSNDVTRLNQIRSSLMLVNTHDSTYV